MDAKKIDNMFGNIAIVSGIVLVISGLVCLLSG